MKPPSRPFPGGVADKISPDPPDRDAARTTRPASRAAPAGARRAPKLGVPRRRGREARMAPIRRGESGVCSRIQTILAPIRNQPGRD
jgi:hypothetical protein